MEEEIYQNTDDDNIYERYFLGLKQRSSLWKDEQTGHMANSDN